ncbi:MAG: hypothetical protein QOE83_108 [Actinomycetota bacterium]|jgi:hypothetical protein|nr:hypothetical protein [Actinomycetota bacterium]
MKCPLTIMLTSAHDVAEALSQFGYVVIELPSLTDRILKVDKAKADALWEAEATTTLTTTRYPRRVLGTRRFRSLICVSSRVALSKP